MRRLVELVEQSHAQATESSGVAQQARTAADSGSAVVREMSGAMEAMHAHSRQISEVVTLIESIAFQTNILALNAAVEAARAARPGAASPWWHRKYGHWRNAAQARPGKSAPSLAAPPVKSNAARA